ncbi:short-chain dehydrogenase [Ktedonobacteria bacterium brp13]|nr:short-chain dehydrogenase [Ktedonobacteria bacterium brp13]
MTKWTTRDIPNLEGRVAIVTGANSGLGLETVRALAAHGAHIVLATRNAERGQQALQLVQSEVPGANLEVASLDLASLRSVREFAAHFLATHDRLDLLFNNAGVMAIPRRETEDGFEMQFGTNHLGHFALTGLLLPLLLKTPESRVIVLTSMARTMGRIDFDNLQGTSSYSRWGAYGQSKRADLLFGYELQHRLQASGASTISVVAHPGYAKTELQTTSATLSNANIEMFFYRNFDRLIAQSAAMGTLPQLYAATAQNIFGGELVGPAGMVRGYPKIDRRARKEYNRPVAARLWDVSTKLTGVDFAELQVPSQSLSV